MKKDIPVNSGTANIRFGGISFCNESFCSQNAWFLLSWTAVQVRNNSFPEFIKITLEDCPGILTKSSM